MMPSKKKSATARGKKPKKSFNSDWAEKLAESKKRLLVERAAKRRMRPASENAETWQKLHSHTIVAGERLQETINKSVTCRFCQASA